jgi:hypothetical protein
MRIVLNESLASRRCIPIMCFQSNGTTPATGESGTTFMFAMGGVFYGSGGSLSAVSAVAGCYMANFSASKVSVLGHGMVMYNSATALPWITPFEVVSEDPWTSQVTIHPGTYSTVTVRIEGVDYSGLTIKGITNYANISNVTLAAGTHSNVTIQGISNYANISSVTLNVGTHSGATIQGVTRINSGVTLNADLHSGATIQGVTRINSGVTLNADVHSGASVEVKAGGIQAGSLGAATITAAKFAAGAVDAVALATDAGQEIADRLIARNIEGGSDAGRIVRDVFSVLRNKVAIDSSILTVFRTDDSTSAWSADVTAGSTPISGIDPAGP